MDNFISTNNEPGLPVAIIGAGPVGLAAGAHLIEHGLTPLILEAGDRVGTSIREWSHVRLFSPWKYCIDEAAVRLLTQSGWLTPDPERLPTGSDLIADYLEPLASLPVMESNISFSSRVIAVGRENLDKMRSSDRQNRPFVLHVEGKDRNLTQLKARAVIDASGTWFSPNPLGSGGIAAAGEKELRDKIHYGIPDVCGTEKARYASKKVLVAGSGHSAANVLLDLAKLRREFPNTEIVWGIRRATPDRSYGGEDADTLSERGALGKRLRQLVEDGGVELLTSFYATGLGRVDRDRLAISGVHADVQTSITVDEVVVCTGFQPDFSFLREIRLSIDPALESVEALAPLIDPNVHSCGTVRPHGERELRHPESGFYIAGMKSYGRAPTFLLMTGYEQVRSIVASLAGDREAADRVELCLPETGVCSTDYVERAADHILQNKSNVEATEPACGSC